MSEAIPQLVQSAAEGNEAAFRTLYARYARRTKAYFLRSGFSTHEADDLLQETFLRVHRSLRTFDPRRGQFGTWLGTIARNVVRKRWAKRKPLGEAYDPEIAAEVFAAEGNPGDSPETREAVAALNECIRQLKDEHAAVIRLRYVSALTTRGISEKLDMPESTVRLRLREAKGLLMQCLRGKGVEA
ncbi:MAG: RNA polymerase sigma factor [Phycisphaerae bacterium]